MNRELLKIKFDIKTETISSINKMTQAGGRLDFNKIENLKTVCLNCAKLISMEGLGWTQGDLVPDF